MGGGCTLGPRGGKAWVGERAGWVGGGGGAGAARARARSLPSCIVCLLRVLARLLGGWSWVSSSRTKGTRPPALPPTLGHRRQALSDRP